jgi:hypothetical protein
MKKKPKRKTTSGTPTTPNEQRHRPNVAVTMSREGLAELDARAAQAGLGRGAFIEQLLRATA